MKAPMGMAPRFLRQCILVLASRLVPDAARADWLLEWRSELWHAGAAADPEVAPELTRFCLGSFQDALCLRRMAWRESARPLRGSAALCLMGLLVALAISYGLSLLLQGVRAQSHPANYQVKPGLIMIQNVFSSNSSRATIPAETYRRWTARRQRYFDGLAFYRMERDGASAAPNDLEAWSVAHASLNLFSLLGLPVRFGSQSKSGVILSDALWKRDFGANRQIVGSFLRIDGRDAEILGVLAEGAWRLPGRPDAWLLEPNTQQTGTGYVIAHPTELGRWEMHGSTVEISSPAADDSNEELVGFSFAERTQGPWALYEFSILLAFLALPALTSVSLGEYHFSENKPSWTSMARRSAFLACKIALLLAAVYFASLDLAYGRVEYYSIPAQYVQLLSSFAMCLFGLRWALLDQRQRCPVCLKRVTHPAQVGLAGRIFLAWNGTELICTGGHTLLHVPAAPTSWFGEPRWLYLDRSWKVLFEGSNAG
jgi:hypothetical protein